MSGLLGIGNFEKFGFKKKPLSECSKTDFKDSTNKVFDLTLKLYCKACAKCLEERKKLPCMLKKRFNQNKLTHFI